MMPAAGDDIIRLTGGQIDGMVMALIDSAHDRDETVRVAILNSLELLGQKQADLVLSSCHSYLIRHKKLQSKHKVSILNIMENVCLEQVETLDKALVITIINHCVMELINTKEVLAEWQNAASNIIVALGKHYHNEVMESLLVPFQPGVVPHLYVIHTLANLATSNSYGIVPYLKAVLSSMMPMLGAVKQDNLKLAFTIAISKFCEAILDYLANIDKAPDKSVRKEVFSIEINVSYDILFGSWLNTRDLKLKWAIIEAVGNMSHLMSKEKVEEQLARLISGMLGLYKKHQDHYNITRGLCMVLESATEISPNVLSIHLETIMSTLFPQVCSLPDYLQPTTAKNHNEILRCFNVLVKNFSDQVVFYLLTKIETGQEKFRIGALIVFKHLINSSAEYLTDKVLNILNGLKPILNETNNKVKIVMSQVIVSMAHHGYLECPGSQVMLDFIIRQCSISPSSTRRATDLEHVSNETLRSMCESILHLLSTTVENMECILWPALLEYLVLDEFCGSIGIICKCVAHLANKKRLNKADDYVFNYNKYTNVPRPHAIIARLFAIVGNPFLDQNRGVNILKLMKDLCPILEKDLVDYWDKAIPSLLKHLQETNEKDRNWSQKDWEDMVLKILSQSLDTMDKDEWTLKLGNMLLNQLHLYNNFPTDKNMALKALGVVMRKTTNKQFINSAISTIFSSIKHTNYAEREGCAVCIGLAAGIHTDALLVKLEEEAKADQKKNSGIFNFIKDMKGESQQDKHNATFILCYGFLALYAPTNILVSRVDTPVLRCISKYYNNSKDIDARIALIHSVDLVAQALHPSNIVNDNFILKSRGELINQMLNMMKNELPGSSHTSLTSTIKAVAMNACSNLLKLPPALSGPTLSTMIQTAATITLSIPTVGPFPQFHTAEHSVSTPGDYNSNNALHTEEQYKVVLEETLNSFNNLLVQMLLHDFSCETLDFIMQNLNHWLLSGNSLERLRTVSSVLNLLKSYQENMNSGNKVILSFTKLGTVLGRLIPRCTDPVLDVRLNSMNCIQLLVQISGSNLTPNSQANRAVPRIDLLKESMITNDPGTLYSATCDFSQVLVDALSSDQIRPFIYTLLDGLEDEHVQSSSGVSLVLKTVLTHKGEELKTDVVEVLDCLHGKLTRINNDQTKIGAFRCIHAIAVHHMIPVISSILNYSLPYDEYVSNNLRHIFQCTICQQSLIFCRDDVHMLKIFALDATFAKEVINYMLDLLQQTAPYSKHQDPRTKNKGVEVKIANHTYAAVICSMTEIFRQSSVESIVDSNFHRIFSALVLATCSFIDVYPPLPPDRRADPNLQLSFLSSRHSQNHPSRWATDAFKSFLLCSAKFGYRIVNNMTDGNYWAALESLVYFPDGIAELARSLAQNSPEQMSNIIAFLNTNSSTVYETQRIGVVAMSAELINQKCDGDHALLELLMNSLIGKLVDPSPVIRKLCIRGLSSIANFGLDEQNNMTMDDWFGVHKYSTTVLSAMMAGMDDRDDPDNDITLEAMSGLSRVLTGIDQEHIRGIQINIALKIRPMIEKDKGEVRAAAVTLFGDLSKVASGQSKGPFVEQIHNNFVSLLLHLNDSEEVVAKACKCTLKVLGPLMDAPNINNMFQKHLLEDGVLRYTDFINDLSKEIIADVGDKVNFYVTSCIQFFKSSHSYMQANAVLLAGCLLGNLPEEKRKDISKEHICGALVLLLKDAPPVVKMKAADAMSVLHSY
ncbi:Maestro heat-like repeat-containing protein family member 1 [Nymphon striatum]|nr:Maestro heat-like repeat-containing protein family member 1 [Nymphon striatum]